MKEKLYTIPLNDAVAAGDECPLCFAERKIEQDALDFTLGNSSSYMEQDIRAMTDREGFCRRHFKQMFDYGNALGSAWILSTHLRAVRRELEAEIAAHRTEGKKTSAEGAAGLFRKLRSRTEETGGAPVGRRDSVAAWTAAREKSCFVCRQIENTKKRYVETFFYLWQKDPEFRRKIEEGKGFCIPHFGDLCEAAQRCLDEAEREEFYRAVFRLMQDNLARLTGDVDWMIEKFDYQNADKDWKNSRDALQRGMQKLKGGYPADAPHRMKK
ncbi:DUF6062 family protein [Lachnoclostridium sp. Marseille-P6806]|uniref:DUF6062 family protein n=1 Tax=Lachnoclostridium sp. Marseille-P6806 TaxID=2364793 RepID=UPI00102FDBCC|nr:DUF6062 family protein [Lachnoclostridium sp. Marseille-P6806]